MKRLVLSIMVSVCLLAGGWLALAPSANAGTSIDTSLKYEKCVPVALPIIAGPKCVDPDTGKMVTGYKNDASSGGAIVFYLKAILQLLGGAVGGIIVLALVVGGIQYITSAGDSGQVRSAKNRVMNAIIALVLYLMMFAILQFLVPGGLFS